MDRGPLRASRPTDTRATTRPETVRRQEETPQVQAAEPRVAATSRTPHHKVQEKKKAKRFLPFVVIITTVLVLLGGWLAWSKMMGATPAVDKSKYQAVFLTNGQGYFGKLTPLSGGYLKLTDVFYLQSQQADQADTEKKQTADQGNFQLIKLGTEVHGPEDTIVVSRDQVLFYENLKDDGKVVQAIKQYKQ